MSNALKPIICCNAIYRQKIVENSCIHIRNNVNILLLNLFLS